MTAQVEKMKAAGSLGMARKPSRGEAKAERRMQLIDATIRCIAKHGLSATTIAKVSDLAGTSVGLAIFHFDNKEKLLEATLQHLADEQRDSWQNRTQNPDHSHAGRLMAIVESRFNPRICTRRKLAIWFAFWGDAGAREIYRRIVGDVDQARLDETVTILSALWAETGVAGRNPLDTALAIEALYDGLWLNMLLYPEDFKRLGCRDKALDYLSVLFPAQISRRPDRDSPDCANDLSDDEPDHA